MSISGHSVRRQCGKRFRRVTMGKASLISRVYLIFYNVSLCIGWGYVLAGAVYYSWTHRPALGSHVPGLYNAIGTALRIFQTAAFLEVSENII